jgi:hypothetical protein
MFCCLSEPGFVGLMGLTGFFKDLPCEILLIIKFFNYASDTVSHAPPSNNIMNETFQLLFHSVNP